MRKGILAAGAVLLSACSAPARRPAGAVAGTEDVRYYADLGPDTVDVSAYPDVQKQNYAVYARACSQCHTLARSVNSPVVSRLWWKFYIDGMRLDAKLRPGVRLSKEDVEAVLDFLDYDSHERKVVHREEFEKLTAELEDRYRPIAEERLREREVGGR